MKKQNLILIALAVLLICNGVLLWHQYAVNPLSGRPSTSDFRPGPEGRERPREIIIQQLHFDELQIKSYDSLINEHRLALRSVNRETLDLKKELYASLLEPINRDSLIRLIGLQQQKVEQINLNHFAAIQKMCRPEQQDDFRKLVLELNQLFNEHHPPPPQRPE